jgi:predicted secreted protein
MKYCDTTTGNQVANRENKPYPKHKRIALLTTELAAVLVSLYHVTRANRVIAVVR